MSSRRGEEVVVVVVEERNCTLKLGVKATNSYEAGPLLFHSIPHALTRLSLLCRKILLEVGGKGLQWKKDC